MFIIRIVEGKSPVNIKEKVFEYILATDVGISILRNIDTFKTVYSNKTFDYMACKKPVLMGINGASRELVEEAKCGIYVEPENIESIVEGINVLINKPKGISIAHPRRKDAIKRCPGSLKRSEYHIIIPKMMGGVMIAK